VTLGGLQSGEASGAISVATGYNLHQPGSVIQTVWARTDTQTTYASAISGNGTAIAALDFSITPVFADSIIAISWMINGEFSGSAWNNVFLIWRDSALITTPGYEGYNSLGGNNRWSGFVGAAYDTNAASTPENYRIFYWQPAGSVAARSYQVAVRSSDGTAKIFYLNRTVSAPADAQEVMISTVMCQEIAQ
jgi:hypothetical protein